MIYPAFKFDAVRDGELVEPFRGVARMLFRSHTEEVCRQAVEDWFNERKRRPQAVAQLVSEIIKTGYDNTGAAIDALFTLEPRARQATQWEQVLSRGMLYLMPMLKQHDVPLPQPGVDDAHLQALRGQVVLHVVRGRWPDVEHLYPTLLDEEQANDKTRLFIDLLCPDKNDQRPYLDAWHIQRLSQLPLENKEGFAKAMSEAWAEVALGDTRGYRFMAHPSSMAALVLMLDNGFIRSELVAEAVDGLDYESPVMVLITEAERIRLDTRTAKAANQTGKAVRL